MLEFLLVFGIWWLINGFFKDIVFIICFDLLYKDIMTYWFVIEHYHPIIALQELP
jgi:hypothetical protein